MNKLPEQLQKQIDAAEEHFKKAANANPDTTEKDVKPENIPAEEVNNVEDVAPQDAQPVTGVVEDENNETYAQRWRSQQGIVASLQSKLGMADQRIANLESLIATMQMEPAPAPAPVKYITEKDTEEFGPEMVDFVNRAISEGTSALKTENDQLKRQIQALSGVVPAVQNVVKQQQQDKELTFWTGITRGIPDWEQINSNPKFQDWLLEADPNTGIMRDVYLKDAQRELDSDRVISIFNSFKQLYQVTNNRSSDNKRVASKELEMQIEPGSKTTQTETRERRNEKVWQRAEVAKFYDDVRKGVFKGKDDQRSQIEADIFQAKREGRLA